MRLPGLRDMMWDILRGMRERFRFSRRRVIIAASALFLIATIVIFTAIIDRAVRLPGPLAGDEIIFVPPGTSLAGVSRILERAGITDAPRLFRLGAWLRRAERSLRAGEYVIPAHASVSRVIDILKHSNAFQRRITIPEGFSSAQTVELLRENEWLSGEIESTPPEGSLLPETYYFERRRPRADVLEWMRRANEATLADAWENRDPDLPFETPLEALILASIVEKETSLDRERPLIAGVFISRLRQGIRLHSDPTVIYGISGGQPLGRRLLRTDTKRPSPYNTYRIDGLPPTPISNPGRKSILAVLNPDISDALYFVADGSGGHVFARTLEEHNRNVARSRRKRGSGG